jgi:DNA-binding beta-propeller fold protein YncE
LNVRQAIPASPVVAWPLLSETARLLWLRACCAVAEGADVLLPHAMPDASSHCTPDVCVAAVLGDGLRRVSVLGGREGMSRSLGSAYSGSVARFLGGSMRGIASRIITTRRVKPLDSGVAVSVDGSTLLVTDCDGGSHAIHVYGVADGSRRRIVGEKGDGPLQFNRPYQIHVTPDDCVFVAEFMNRRVHVLTPSLDFHSFIGVGELSGPVGVCASVDVVVVSETRACSIVVFDRGDGALLRRFGSEGGGDGQLRYPSGLCFMPGHRHVAVADYGNNRVSIFSVDGEFIRHVGVGVLNGPRGVACSAFDELVVADSDNHRVALFGGSGEMAMAVGSGSFCGVTVHGGVVMTQDSANERCVVFT